MRFTIYLLFFGVCLLSLASVDFLLEVIMPEGVKNEYLHCVAGYTAGHSALLGTPPPPTPRWLICRQEDGLAAQVCPIYSIPATGGSLYLPPYILFVNNLFTPLARQFRRTSVTTRINEFKKCISFKGAPSTLLCLFPLT
jgi:hypothetical protein